VFNSAYMQEQEASH